MKKLLVGLLVLAGCANEPIVDTKGVNPAQYQQDLAECREYAARVDTGTAAATGAAVGAAVGGVLGAVIGDSDDAQRGAGVGAVSGGTNAALSAEERKRRVLYNCLRQRGYKVLG